MNNQDVEGVMGCCLDGPDLVFILYGNILRGSEAVRGFVTNMFAGARSIHLEIDEIKRWCFGETVFAVGIATYEIVAMDGTKSRLRECWTDARRSVAGKWVYVLNHATEIPG
jgi:ketosteroid isomerase-like protein